MTTNYSERDGYLYALECEMADALNSLPEVPCIEILYFLSVAGSTSRIIGVGEEGKRLQRAHGLAMIPPRSEYERAAGLWSMIRKGLLELEKAP